MKVVFNHLDKYKFLVNAYHSLQLDPIEADICLTYKQLMFLENANEVDTINGTYLGVKFKGNYVEFDDILAKTYIDLLYKAKIRSPYFEASMQEDEITFMQYKLAREDINKIDDNIRNLKESNLSLFKQFSLMEQAKDKIKKRDFDDIKNQMETIANMTNMHLKKLQKERIEKIMYIFGLEGPIKEYVEDDDDDLFIKEL